MSVLPQLGAALRARRMTLLFWTAIILMVSGAAAYSRAAAARTQAALASPSVPARDREVGGLIERGSLLDALAATQDPNEDAKGVQNIRSVTLRQNAVDSVNRLAGAHQISDTQALDTLFLLRKDVDQSVKDRATAGLAALGRAAPGNLAAIVSRLKDGDPDIRSAAADALGKIGGAVTAQKIDRLLKDPTAQDAAQAALQNIGAASVPLLLARLSDPDITFRQRIVSMLGQIASPQSVPDLNRVAASDSPSVRRLALVALADIVLNNYNLLQKAQEDARTSAGNPKSGPLDVQNARETVRKAAAGFAQARLAEPALIGAVRNPEDDGEARIQSALALGRLGSAPGVGTLTAALGDYDSRVRNAALQGIQSAGPLAVGTLTVALKQGQDVTRAAAAQALGGIGTGPAVAAVQSVLTDPETPVSVHRSAVIGLGQSGSPTAAPILVALLGDPDGVVASAASDALLTPALEKQAIPLLIASFNRSTPVPFNASRTLSRMGTLPIPALEAAASSHDAQAQTWAAVTLGQMDARDPAVIAGLKPLTRSADTQVRYAATQALGRMSGT